jgi:hypothetical protein
LAITMTRSPGNGVVPQSAGKIRGSKSVMRRQSAGSAPFLARSWPASDDDGEAFAFEPIETQNLNSEAEEGSPAAGGPSKMQG